MTLHQLKVWAYVVKFGSMTKTAKYLGVAQPSISQQMIQLEQEVGRTLYEVVNGRGLVFTKQGKQLAKGAGRVQKEMMRIRREMRTFQ